MDQRDLKIGDLILVASVAGLLPLPTQTVYVASKHAVVRLSRSIRMTRFIAYGIRVNSLCSHLVDTPILSRVGPFLLAAGAMATTDRVVETGPR